MDSFQIFGLQVFLSFIVYGLIAKWYVAPRLANLPLHDALVPLLFTHTFRHVGLVMMVPVVTDPALPHAWTAEIGYGDLAAQLLALASILAIRSRAGIALPLVWLFNIVGAVDLIIAYVWGAQIEAYRYHLASAWYVPTFIVPLLLVTHFMIFWLLVRRPRTS